MVNKAQARALQEGKRLFRERLAKKGFNLKQRELLCGGISFLPETIFLLKGKGLVSELDALIGIRPLKGKKK